MKRIAYQAGAIALFAAAAWYLVSNTLDNLAARNIASGFAFLGREAGFEIGESPFAYSAADTYLRALAVGLANTFKVSLVGVVLASALGFAVGLGRLSRNLLLRALAGALVGFLRNTPPLVALFFWYAFLRTAL